jgi:hypothetical protein
LFSRQDAKNAKFGFDFSLRPLRPIDRTQGVLCGRYSGSDCQTRYRELKISMLTESLRRKTRLSNGAEIPLTAKRQQLENRRI